MVSGRPPEARPLAVLPGFAARRTRAALGSMDGAGRSPSVDDGPGGASTSTGRSPPSCPLPPAAALPGGLRESWSPVLSPATLKFCVSRPISAAKAWPCAGPPTFNGCDPFAAPAFSKSCKPGNLRAKNRVCYPFLKLCPASLRRSQRWLKTRRTVRPGRETRNCWLRQRSRHARSRPSLRTPGGAFMSGSRSRARRRARRPGRARPPYPEGARALPPAPPAIP